MSPDGGGVAPHLPSTPSAEVSQPATHVRLVAMADAQGSDLLQLRRDVRCLQALFDAVDATTLGDADDRLLSAGIAGIAANVWRLCWQSLQGTYPHQILHAAGQIHALAVARDAVFDQIAAAPSSQHATLADQVKWLDTLAYDVLGRLAVALREIP